MKILNKSKILIIFIFFIIVIIALILILIGKNNNKDKYEIDDEKIYYEINYLDNELVEISNLLNSSSLNIKWNDLSNKVNILYNYWNSTILDFNELAIDNTILTNFGKDLDNLNLSINNKDKQSCFANLLELYSKVNIYYEKSSYNQEYIGVINAKYYILKACSIVDTNNWTLVYDNILEADKSLLNTINTINKNEYVQYNLNQAYVSIKELENIINIKNVDIFYLKYNIVMSKIKNI